MGMQFRGAVTEVRPNFFGASKLLAYEREIISFLEVKCQQPKVRPLSLGGGKRPTHGNFIITFNQMMQIGRAHV